VTDLGPFQALDTCATRDEARQSLTLCVINRDPTETVETAVELTGGAFRSEGKALEVNGPDLASTNSFSDPRRVSVREYAVSPEPARARCAFPPHSVTVLSFAT
jgi:alpha-L-arabinofuranosidase